MGKRFFSKQAFRRWINTMFAMWVVALAWGQSEGERTTEELVALGFENVRWTENDEERIYTIENNVYKTQGIGVAKAIDIIQKYGFPFGKPYF